MSDPLLNRTQLAEALHLTVDQIRALVTQGAPVAKRGRRGRGKGELYDLQAFREWMANSSKSPIESSDVDQLVEWFEREFGHLALNSAMSLVGSSDEKQRMRALILLMNIDYVNIVRQRYGKPKRSDDDPTIEQLAIRIDAPIIGTKIPILGSV